MLICKLNHANESSTHTEKQILKKRAIVFSDSRFCHTQSQGPVYVRIDDPREHQRSRSEEIITVRVVGDFTIS